MCGLSVIHASCLRRIIWVRLSARLCNYEWLCHCCAQLISVMLMQSVCTCIHENFSFRLILVDSKNRIGFWWSKLGKMSIVSDSIRRVGSTSSVKLLRITVRHLHLFVIAWVHWLPGSFILGDSHNNLNCIRYLLCWCKNACANPTKSIDSAPSGITQ